MIVRKELGDAMRLESYRQQIPQLNRLKREAREAGDAARVKTLQTILDKYLTFAVKMLLGNGYSMIRIANETAASYYQVRKAAKRHYIGM